MVAPPPCADCRHRSSPRHNFGSFLCFRPVSAVSGVRAPVDGRHPVRLLRRRCEEERRGNRTINGRSKCGPGALFFEPGA